MLLLLLFLQVLGEDADEPLVIAPHVAYGESDQGVVCVLLHKGKHTAHGEVTLHGGPLCDVRCVACVVVRCVSCVVENKKSNTKMVYRPALRRRARSGAAPARRRATPLCKKTRGGEINT